MAAEPIAGDVVDALSGEVADFVPPAEAAAFLRADHEVLEEVAGRLLATIEDGDQDDVGDAVTEMQLRIRAHLDGEERDLLPAYAEHAPEDAAELLAEHAAIRSALAELDIATDLHLIRLEAVRDLLGRLRAHARRENDGLYRWTAHRDVTH